MQDLDQHDAAIETIVRMMGVRTGLTFRADQYASTKQGIERAMARSDISDPEQYARLLQFDVAALDNLIVELTVGETYFFREPHQFHYIRDHILPGILRRHGPDHCVRIWSAGCASGEEPYSLAMLCHREGLSAQCSILATDISSEALGKAERASYGDWSLRARNRISADEYLKHDGSRYHVVEQIRRMVRFEFLNLALDVYPSFETATKSLDLILCRNVLIYFGDDTIRAVASRLFDSLADGGWLITASGDPPLSDFAPFETVVTDSGIFYRRPVEAGGHVSARQDSMQDAPLPEFDLLSEDESTERTRERDLPSSPLEDKDAAPPGQVRLAEQALADGDYQVAAELTQRLSDDLAACVVHLKALANIDRDRAVSVCEELIKRHSLSAELYYLHAVLLLELNLDVEAVQAAQRAIYLDRSLPISHFLLGSLLQRRGALAGARQAFRNARDLCRDLPADQPLALVENETAGHLAQAAELQLAAIRAALPKKQ